MTEAWMPVLFAAVIVLGVVGGTVVHAVLKELLPLLRTLLEERTANGGSGARAELDARVSALERDVQAIQIGHDELRAETEFLQRLLAEPGATTGREPGSSVP